MHLTWIIIGIVATLAVPIALYLLSRAARSD
jgi:hypothetical protein